VIEVAEMRGVYFAVMCREVFPSPAPLVASSTRYAWGVLLLPLAVTLFFLPNLMREFDVAVPRAVVTSHCVRVQWRSLCVETFNESVCCGDCARAYSPGVCVSRVR